VSTHILRVPGNEHFEHFAHCLGPDVDEDDGDVGLTILNNGQEYPMQVALKVRNACGVRVGDLQSSDTRRDEDKARIW